MKVVVWENDAAESGLFNEDVFFDFFKPIQIFDGDGWNPELRFIERCGQYVLTLAPVTVSSTAACKAARASAKRTKR